MSWIESLLLAIGLSMDSLAASVATGITLPGCRLRHILFTGAATGFFHIGMMLAGFLAGDAFGYFIRDYDHWIAFVLLICLGGRMMWQGIFPATDANAIPAKLPVGDVASGQQRPFHYPAVVSMALATSVDALAVGASVAFLNTDVWTPLTIVGGVTFLFSASGVYAGSRFGGRIRLNLNILGGVILAGIGCRILIEHLLN